MNNKRLGIWIKVILTGLGISGIAVFLFAIPELGQSVVYANPEFSFAYLPWLIFLWIAALPCFAALPLGWKIASEISADRAFTLLNSRLLRIVSILAAADSAFFFAGNIVLLLVGMNHPGIIIASAVVSFIGTAIAVASMALSGLTERAAAIQQENELTI